MKQTRTTINHFSIRNILLAITLLAVHAHAAKRPSVEQLFSVQSVKVKRQSIAVNRDFYGFVRMNDANVQSVAPRFGGYVETLYANRRFQYVKKGEPLLTLYSPAVYKAKEDYINSLAYTSIKGNQQMLQSAKLNLTLLGISTREIKALEKNEKRGKSKKIETTTTIYAPISGYIFKKNITQGAAFKAGENLFEIVNLDDVWVEARIFEEELTRVKSAKTFTVRVKSNSTTYRATKKIFYPKEDDATLTLRLALKNPHHALFPGMYATITASTAKKSLLVVPQDAVIVKNGRYYVFIVGEFEGEYEPKEVKLNVLDAHYYSVLSGLNEGDEIVNNALFMQDSDAQINGLY